MDTHLPEKTEYAYEDIDPRVFELYDRYCHSGMTRREFLDRAAAIAVIGGSGLAMAQALLPNYARANMIMFTDKRIKAKYVDYDSPRRHLGQDARLPRAAGGRRAPSRRSW